MSCTETLKARQKPQESPLAKSLNKASTSADAKLEKKILTAFTVVALERPFDDYETEKETLMELTLVKHM